MRLQLPQRGVKLAINPLQFYGLQDDGVGLRLEGDYLDVLTYVHEAGFEAVTAEIQTREEETAYRRSLQRCGLKAAPGYFSAPLSDESKLEDTLQRAASFAAAHHALGLTEACLADELHAERVEQGPPRRTPPSTSERETIVRTITAVGELWQELGIAACVHNHVGSYIETADEIDDALSATDPATVRYCPDTGHLRWAGIDPLDAVRRHRDRIDLVHLKDLREAVLAKGAMLGWGYGEFVRAGLWAEPGLGDLDLPAVMAELKGFDGWLIIEVDQTPSASGRDSLRLCMYWATQLVPSFTHV